MIDFPMLSEEEAAQQLAPPTDPKLFVSFILTFYHHAGRSFPWRDTTDSYAVLLSEVMLQQTQTLRALGKYQEFLSLWPNFQSLAEAKFDDVLYHWRGLGYNRRALALHKTAKATERWNWTLPNDEQQLLALPGVGPSTAAAIVCFCYHDNAIYLETNIRRVMLYTFHHDEERVSDKTLRRELQDLLPLVPDSKEWYYALMDYGVLLKHLVPNANKKSSTYTVQSAFKGSDREIRGRVIHTLSEKGEQAIDEIVDELPFDGNGIRSALTSLVKDGLVEESSERYRIASN